MSQLKAVQNKNSIRESVLLGDCFHYLPYNNDDNNYLSKP